MLDYRTSQYGDHAPGECAALRAAGDGLHAQLTATRMDDPMYAVIREAQEQTNGGWHAGWGICAGRCAVPSHETLPASARCHRVSPFTRRALAADLPSKVLA